MQALSAVQGHPHIVALHDVWFEHGSGGPGDHEAVYFKLELCGESLKGMFKRKTPFKESLLLEVMKQVGLMACERGRLSVCAPTTCALWGAKGLQRLLRQSLAVRSLAAAAAEKRWSVCLKRASRHGRTLMH